MMSDQKAVPNEVTYLVATPRGRTAVAAVPPSLSYEAFVGCLLDAAVARDLEQHHCHSHHQNQSQMMQYNNSQSSKKPRSSLQQQHEDTTCARSGSASRNVRRCSRQAFVVHNGKVLGREEYNRLVQSNDSGKCQRREFSVSLRFRLRGGIDRQNRVGSKFGGGGVSSSQNSERERKERLKELALESIDLAKDPYLMRNHLGTYECKLCLTLHPNEANYLSHTQGKKHQSGLGRRAFLDKARLEQQGASGQMPMALLSGSSARNKQFEKKVRIGRPAYQVFKSRDVDTNQRCLSFELQYPEIDKDIQPRHRFMSAYEQRVDSPPDRRYQYLLVAADPYETVSFKIPNEPIDKGEGRFVTHWEEDEKKFTLTLYFLEPEIDSIETEQ